MNMSKPPRSAGNVEVRQLESSSKPADKNKPFEKLSTITVAEALNKESKEERKSPSTNVA